MTPTLTLRRKTLGLINGNLVFPERRWPPVSRRGLLPGLELDLDNAPRGSVYHHLAHKNIT